MAPIDLVLSKLPDAKRAGNGWAACCPAHDDRRPSLSIAEGDDGRVLLRCHSGCTAEAAAAAMGLAMADLMPRTTASSRPASKAPSRPAKAFSTARDAVAALERQHGGPKAAFWTYRDAQGDPVGLICRWNLPGGKKDIRPVAKNGTGWVLGGMPEPRPLYNLPELLARSTDRVFIVEGEKTAEAARSVGLLSTTSAHGCKSPGKTDWRPLAGRDVVLLPDYDAPGWKYADAVTDILCKLNPPATVRIVNLPELPAKGDFVEFLEARQGVEPEAIAGEVQALADGVEPERPEAPAAMPAVPVYRPFPLDLLPKVLRRFIVETAKALGCDCTMVALPTLANVGAAIGTARAAEPKQGWIELPIIWAAVVARSGTTKSPAFDVACEPMRRIQNDAFRAHAEAAADYERAMAVHDLELVGWKRAKNLAAEPPPRPEQPRAQRFVVSDSTVEALAPILAANPRGLLLARDELSGWLRSFDAYKNGRGGDVAAWLELWRGGTVVVDRKTTGAVHIPRAAVAVCGTIQPSILSAVLTVEHWESGLAARLLLAMPPVRPKTWSTQSPSAAALQGYADLLGNLMNLQPADDGYGPQPMRLPFSPAAMPLWESWYNEHGRRQHDAADDRQAAALAKFEAYAARFALIVALADDPTATEIPEQALAAGIGLADWFAAESERVYSLMAENPKAREQRQLADLIGRKGGRMTARRLQQSKPRQYRTADEAEQALAGLVKGGFGQWRLDDHGGRPGRPVNVFVLSMSTQLPYSQEIVNCVCVDSVDTGENAAPEAVADYAEQAPANHGLNDNDWGEI